MAENLVTNYNKEELEAWKKKQAEDSNSNSNSNSSEESLDKKKVWHNEKRLSHKKYLGYYVCDVSDIKEAVARIKKRFHIGVAYFSENIDEIIDEEFGELAR